MAHLIRLGPQYFPKVDLSTAVGIGTLYIGEVDTDPTIVDNQIQVQALQENGSLVDIFQPITLSAGGIPLHEGSPVSLYTDGDYSLKILDSSGGQIYYVPWTPGAIFDTLTVGSWPTNHNIAQFDGARGLEDSGEPMTNVGLLDESKEWTGQQNFDEDAFASSGTEANWDLNESQCATITLAENTTIMNPTNMKAGGTYVLRIVQAAGVFGLAWDTAYEWGAKAASAAPAADGDVIVLTFYSDGATMYSGEFNRTEA
jgi:hypothetical protein